MPTFIVYLFDVFLIAMGLLAVGVGLVNLPESALALIPLIAGAIITAGGTYLLIKDVTKK